MILVLIFNLILFLNCDLGCLSQSGDPFFNGRVSREKIAEEFFWLSEGVGNIEMGSGIVRSFEGHNIGRLNFG